MAYRSKMKRSSSKKIFKRTAGKAHVKNRPSILKRGGTRL